MKRKQKETCLKKTCSIFILATLGILLCIPLLTAFGGSDSSITLTENNHVVFAGEVNDTSVAKAQLEMGRISSRLSTNDVIYLVIDSPGGSVSAGNLFIDFAKSLPQKVKPICIFCASMGYHMFQSFDERLVYSSSMLMSHRVSIGGLSGQVPGEALSRLQNIINTSNEMDAKVAKRIGVSLTDYQKSIYDELWLSGDAAVKTRHADRVAKIKCSNDLMTETKVQNVRTIFGPVDVTTSACPLINGILELKFKRENFRSVNEAAREVKRVKRSVTWNY